MTPKPKKTDPAIVAKAAEKLADELMKWAALPADHEQRPQYIEDAKEVLVDAGYKDGFQLAKELDSYRGYDGDSELVEVLEDCYRHLDQPFREAVAAWISENNITPPGPIGSWVRFIDPRSKQEQQGEIIRIDEATAQVVVHCFALGHVRPGAGNGTTGLYLDYSEVHPV